MRFDAPLQRWLQHLALAVAAPTLLLPGCGRSELVGDFQPDAALVLRSADAGVDAGRDAGPIDAGPWVITLREYCTSFPLVDGGLLVRGGLPSEDAGFCAEQCPPDSYSRNQPVTVCNLVPPNLVCWSDGCLIGRNAESAELRRSARTSLGVELSNMAAREASAVFAFMRLAEEVQAHDLPRALVDGAVSAARDEVRHARLVGALARRHGGEFSTTVPRRPVRSLEDLALENAVEGCVRETLGAVIGQFQARHASDPMARAVLASVSHDELGHAAWSWSLARHLDPRLARPARRRVREARERALAEAVTQLSDNLTPELRRVLGAPDAERLNTFASRLRVSSLERRSSQ